MALECGLTILIAFLLLCCLRLLGTTIVAVRTPDAIIIGADSKVTNISGPERAGTCKIWKISGQEAFAQSGFDAYGDDANGTVGDFRATTNSALIEPGEIEVRISKYETTMLKALRRLYKSPYVETVPPQKRKPGAILMETIFIGFREGKPLLAKRGFVYRSGTVHEERTLRYDCLANCASTQAYAPAGEIELLDKQTVVRALNRFGFVGGINHLIGMEAEAHPNTTGGPISIARIDRLGVRFIQPGLCGNGAAGRSED